MLTARGTDPEPTPLPEPTEYAQQLFDGANAERTKAGLAELEWSECLVEPAIERAEVAADGDNLIHEVLVLDCADGAKAGENLSRSDESADSIVQQWMDS